MIDNVLHFHQIRKVKFLISNWFFCNTVGLWCNVYSSKNFDNVAHDLWSFPNRVHLFEVFKCKEVFICNDFVFVMFSDLLKLTSFRRAYWINRIIFSNPFVPPPCFLAWITFFSMIHSKHASCWRSEISFILHILICFESLFKIGLG